MSQGSSRSQAHDSSASPASFAAADGTPVASVSAAEMREIDRLATGPFGLLLLQLMENAGRGLAEVIMETFAASPRTAVVLAGAGGNGGGGLSAARHLHNRGVEVSIVLDRPPAALGGAARAQLLTLHSSGLEPCSSERLAERLIARADVVVDALVGYGLSGALTGRAARLVHLANRYARTLVSLDLPSGLDASAGLAAGAAAQPDLTVTLALPKTVLTVENAHTGPVYLADIGIPPEVMQAASIAYQTPFHGRAWVLLRVVEQAHQRAGQRP